MKTITTDTGRARASGLALICLIALSGCAMPLSLPSAVRPAVFDFGPGLLTAPPASSEQQAPLVIAEVEAPVALDSSAVLYRLGYADAQQLQPYALARWSMTPAQLLHQRLRAHLGQNRVLLNPTDHIAANAAAPRTLRIELEEFSHLFSSPTQSTGLIRLRATLTQNGSRGDHLLAQRSVVVQRLASTADAAGGVRALTDASDAAVREIETWLQRKN
jgi:cholesterol transport system auxiliary component